MSLLKANAVQLGQSLTASQNFTWYQPASPDGTVRLGNGNSGSVTDLITVGSTGNLTFANSISLSAASTRTLTLNGGAGSNGLVIDANNCIGVGISPASSSFKLDVGGINGTNLGIRSTGTSDAVIRGYVNGTESATMRFVNGGGLYWEIAGTRQLTLDTAGNLGLGVTPSAWGSAWKAYQYQGGSIASPNGSNNLFIQNAYNNGTNYISLSTAQCAYYQQSNGLHIWTNSNNTNVTVGATWTPNQAMTLDASGNLLVGATNQFGKVSIQVDGTTTPTTGANVSPSSINLYASTNGGSTDCTTGIFGWFTSVPNGIGSGIGFSRENSVNWGSQIRFYTHPTTTSNISDITERMRLDASGNLLVGTTSTVSGAGFYSRKAGIAGAFAVTGTSVQSTSALIVSKPDATNTTAQIFAQFYVGDFATGSGQINANGASAAAFGSYSDIRLKENIAPLPDQLANICALKPSEFDFKDGSGHQIGFIAQEMQEVYPDVVGEGEDGMKTITGWSKTEARLVKAIQELSAEIETLKQRIK